MGGATSRLFCKEGAKVAILDINEKAGHEIVSEINLSGGEAVFLKTDVSKSEEISKSIDVFMDNGNTKEEEKITNELAKILKQDIHILKNIQNQLYGVQINLKLWV
mgnify:CR=1 FL=1